MPDTPDVMIRQWFEELWNQKREDAIDRLLAPEGKIYGLPTPDNRPLSGPAEFKPFFRQFRAAFPDIQVTVLRTITQGDLVAAHCQVKGTHLGDALGTTATHRAVEFSGMCMARAAGTQFVEGWNAFDFLSLYRQIGLVQ
jgi:predicted ester cyclase